MAAPTIGKRRRWTPPVTAKVDWSHPLAPGCGWIPSMGYRSIHGDPVLSVGSGSCIPGSTIYGSGNFPQSSNARMGWANRITGTPVGFTFGYWFQDFYHGKVSSSPLFTRSAGLNATGPSIDGSGNWQVTWNDNPTTWGYTGGPNINGTSFAAMVVTATGIDFYTDGVFRVTQTVANTMLNFSSLSGATAWQTGDPNSPNTTIEMIGAAYLMWPQALTASGIASLYADPFQMLRW